MKDERFEELKNKGISSEGIDMKDIKKDEFSYLSEFFNFEFNFDGGRHILFLKPIPEFLKTTRE